MQPKTSASLDKVFQENAAQLFKIANAYAFAAIKQLNDCRHCESSAEEACERCSRAADNLNYYSVCLMTVAAAVVEDKAAQLYDVLTKFAFENLPDFPLEIAASPLYEAESEFPEFIETAEHQR